MLEKYLIQQCKIVSPTRNEYGDYIEGAGTTEDCRFREISTQRRVSHAELEDTDAMLWLKSTATVNVGSIILFEEIHYQVERITKARKLGRSTIEFVKCDLKITDLGIS